MENNEVDRFAKRVHPPPEPQRVPPPVLKTEPAGWYPDHPSGRMRWWDGVGWTDTYGTSIQTHATNHVFHLIMSIITVGLWIPIWIIVSISNASARK